MPTSADDKKQLERVQNGVALDASLKLVERFPPFPEEVKRRFPSLVKHEEAVKDWHTKLLIALKGGVP